MVQPIRCHCSFHHTNVDEPVDFVCLLHTHGVLEGVMVWFSVGSTSEIGLVFLVHLNRHQTVCRVLQDF
jgi:hypothetical protein